ncbi:MAG: MFS transporter, partial [Candidatus Falkowbacteria bacterium]|nr:MFS transporter [Candidatus Falkowbacteria bacterium]
LGALSDRIGRRPIMILSICSSALGWFIFAQAHNIWFLFLGRIIDGLAAGNFSTAQSYLSDIAKTDQERTKNLGLIGAIFGVAFLIGPAIGGLLSNVSPAFPFWCVGVMASLNAINAIFNLPESHLNRKGQQKILFNPFVLLTNVLRDKKLLPGFIVWFLFSLAIAINQAILALYLGKVFAYGAFVTGIIFTGMGGLISFNQAFLLPKVLLKKFKERDLELVATGVFALGFLLMSSSWLGIFTLGIIGTTFGQSILRIVLTSQIVGNSYDRKGQVLGAMNSAMSLAMIIGSLFAGALFLGHVKWPFLTAFMLGLASLATLYINGKRLSKFAKNIDVPNDETIL